VRVLAVPCLCLGVVLGVRKESDHGGEDPFDEKRVKEQRCRQEHDGERGDSILQSGRFSLKEKSCPLQEEVEGGETEPSASGKRDDQFVGQSRGEESRERSSRRTEQAYEGAKNVHPGPVAEGTIPSWAPEFPEALRGPGSFHDGRNRESCSFPEKGEDCEGTKVEQAKHGRDTNPACCNGIVEARNDEGEQE